MPQEDVFELTASVSVVLESSEQEFEFAPTTFEPSEEPVEEIKMPMLAQETAAAIEDAGAIFQEGWGVGQIPDAIGGFLGVVQNLVKILVSDDS